MNWGIAILTALAWLTVGLGVLLWAAWDVFARMLDWLDEE